MHEKKKELANSISERLNLISDIAGKAGALKRRQFENLHNDIEKLVRNVQEESGGLTADSSERVDVILDAVRLIASGKNIQEVLQGALAGAARIVGANSGAIVFREEMENDAYPSITYPSDTKEKYLYSKTIIEKVIDTGEGVFESDVSRSSNLVKSGSIVKGRISSVLAAPIKSFGEITGVVYLDSRATGSDLDENDLHYLCDFAAFASLAYESIYLATRRIEFLEKDNRDTYSVMVGKSRGLKHVEELIARYAPLKQPVLITGETGTGKKLVADELHHRSEVAGPFIVVNCAGIPETLFESELFGHAKGAFTDAIKDRTGLIEIAQDGTLFLDEIGELSMGTQSKLLLFLDDRKYRRLGENETRKSNARIVAATNRILPELIREKTFREDLYYRLNVLSIELPPLRMRNEDIPELCKYFVDRECRNLNRPFMTIQHEVVARLRTMPWKGNVREFKNLIQRLVIHTDDMLITTDALDKVLAPSHSGEDPFAGLQNLSEEDVTNQMRKRALDLENGNVAAAARRLGITPPTLHKWLKKQDELKN